MSWSKCLYLYQKEREGRFLGDAKEGELILDHKGKALTVNQYLPEGRYGVSRIQACITVELPREYELTVSPYRRGNGLFALLEEGFFEADLGRRIITNNEAFTRTVLESQTLREVLKRSPDKQVEIHHGPEGTHMLRVYVLSPERPGSSWPVCAVDNDYSSALTNADEIRTQFYPPFARLLELTRALHDAVTAAATDPFGQSNLTTRDI